ncbi:MAG TPA: DNA cytosine methyltransferase [Thermoleophilaceae bacterium]|nr:DNA cytosine methyltransferase [Thermoleophilaceae bacterium]
MSLTVTDLFCGAGGSSIGATVAGTTLRLGLNHWDRAVETHNTNFPDADHDCANVSDTNPRRYRSTDILLASPECTNHSLAKGARRRKPQAGSLFDDGPSSDAEQERSRATMWDVIRFAEAHEYKAIVVENVVDAFKWGPNDDGSLFDAWLMAMRALGYEHEIVFFNSMFAPPVPQSRDRMYVVFWRKGIRRPNLRFEPVSWCPSCEKLVDGRQTWKRPDRRPWGRYGPQYLYSCPECFGTVLPGAMPASTAIDWTLPAELIGDRKRPLADATRERIRRGLERLMREPFEIGFERGHPKPLTLPLVDLAELPEAAMVFPVAGNTFERTPGNRARDASTHPADTVHATLDRAMVVPPMGKVDPRDAYRAPTPTQTTTTRGALVMANTENHVPKPAGETPSPTLRTEGGLAVVLSNMANNVPKIADEEPAATVTSGGKLGVVELQANGGVRSPDAPVHTVRAGGQHHGVIMRNNSGGAEMCTPAHEPIRTLTTGCHQSLVIPYTRTGTADIAERDPSATLSTRDRLALVVPAGGNWRDDSTPALEQPGPTQTSRESFALAWGDEEIDACRFRMFALHEIANTMQMANHPDGSEYIVLGNKREQMAQYGNGVTPPVMALIVARIREALDA